MTASNEPKFTSTAIAEKMAKAFGAKAKTVSIDVKHRRAVGSFVHKIEKAHQQAAKSTQVYG